MSEALYAQMKQTVIDGEVEDAERLAKEGLDAGLDPSEILDKGFVKGIEEVGDLFGEGEFFLSELVQGAEAMKAAVAVLQPAIDAAGGARTTSAWPSPAPSPATSSGDRQDDRLLDALAAGFTVTDVGCDVPVATFVEKCEEEGADLLSAPACSTTTMPNQQKDHRGPQSGRPARQGEGDDRRRSDDPRLGRRDRRRRLTPRTRSRPSPPPRPSWVAEAMRLPENTGPPEVRSE